MSGLGAWQIESTGIGLELNTWLLMWDPNLCKHEGNREMLKQRGNTVYQNISNTWLLRKLCITVVSFFFFKSGSQDPLNVWLYIFQKYQFCTAHAWNPLKKNTHPRFVGLISAVVGDKAPSMALPPYGDLELAVPEIATVFFWRRWRLVTGLLFVKPFSNQVRR